MTMRLLYIFFVSLLLATTLCLFWPLPFAEAVEEEKVTRVMVSILPQEYFVKRIGGSRVQVQTLVQPGHSPATYAPTPKQMAALATTDIYFRIGVPFENALMPKLTRSIPRLPIKDLRQGIDLIELEESHEEHNEEHGDLDPHTWLDPMLALRQSMAVRDTLMQFDPEGAEEFNMNFSSLARDLKELDTQLKDILKPFAGKTIYAFHPAYGYFCRAYGLKQKAINPDGKEPGARYLARLIEQANKDGVKVIFVQPQFSDKAARTISKSINGNVIALDPLAMDYLSNMRSIARQLTHSLAQQGQ